MGFLGWFLKRTIKRSRDAAAECGNCRHFVDMADADEPDDDDDIQKCAYLIDTLGLKEALKIDEYGGPWTDCRGWCRNWEQGPSLWRRVESPQASAAVDPHATETPEPTPWTVDGSMPLPACLNDTVRRGDVVTMWNEWRCGLPADRPFRHSDGVNFLNKMNEIESASADSSRLRDLAIQLRALQRHWTTEGCYLVPIPQSILEKNVYEEYGWIKWAEVKALADDLDAALRQEREK